jgi:hypothetical protein
VKSDVCYPWRYPEHFFSDGPVHPISAQAFDFKRGAGEGNRTLVISLEGWMTAKRIKGIAAKPHASATNGINRLRLFCKTHASVVTISLVDGSVAAARLNRNPPQRPT